MSKTIIAPSTMRPGSQNSLSLTPLPLAERYNGDFDTVSDLPHARRKKKISRTMRACDLCRLKKAKCDGDTPCKSCLRRATSCTYTHVRRNSRPYTVLAYAEMLGRQQATLIEAIQILHQRLRTGEALDDFVSQSIKEAPSVNEILQHLGLTPLELSEVDSEHSGRYSQSIVSPASSSTTTPASGNDCHAQPQVEWGDYQDPLTSPDKMTEVETPAKHSRDQSFEGVEPPITDQQFEYSFWGNDDGLEAQDLLRPPPSPSPGDTFSDAQLGWDFAETCPLSYLAPAGKSGRHQSFRLVF
ncbi:hypothetical protein AYL99_05687 [Fonsecaea erecta]|uniref:Zn(2)-C6 fungal-type domain-containing protein n=1 Tax=Fonsecaea erecta TaxID=1367422 RepID=A0A178ZNU9_9EURO|nr:hypothetical protein AYL99_05687 [Fonsecaea erecta]OAP60685.1 hypothetical protein AYL99_05687 [Fonsecaea erecta]